MPGRARRRRPRRAFATVRARCEASPVGPLSSSIRDRPAARISARISARSVVLQLAPAVATPCAKDLGGSVVQGADAAGKPSVSFVVATFNERRYIAACLDSLLCQDYPSELV